MTVHAPEAITVCNIYLPENAPVTRFNLESLVHQLPLPFIFLGDFNAHDRLWGSTAGQCNRRGRILSSFICDHNLVLLNNGEKTRFNSFSGDFSTIDLCILLTSLVNKLTLSIHDDRSGSDHYPLLIRREQIFTAMFLDQAVGLSEKRIGTVLRQILATCGIRTATVYQT